MDNNPLRQYFRRPSVYLKLPSGGMSYGPDVLSKTDNGEYPVFPMTAIDEITVRTPDALFNGLAVTDLIKSCIPSFIDPWKINSSDLDAVLIAIKAASGGDNLEVDSTCPKCETTNKYGISLLRILSTLKAGDYTKEIETGELKVKFRPLTYKEMNDAAQGQFELQKVFANIDSLKTTEEQEKAKHRALANVTSLTMELISKTIEYILTPNGMVTEKEFILDFLQNCDRNTYVFLRDYNAKLKETTELQPLTIDCISCQHQYSQQFTLNPSDFFA